MHGGSGGRATNAAAWARVAQRHPYQGVIATTWSRYSVDRVQCVPIDSALDSLINVGVILHDGRPPAGGIDACINALAGLGEKQRYEACKKAVTRLAAIRRRSWELVQQVREQIVLGRIDPRCTSARHKAEGLKCLSHLSSTVTKAERIGDEIRQSFDGLVQKVFLAEYIATRVTPLREELDDLTAKAAKLK